MVTTKSQKIGTAFVHCLLIILVVVMAMPFILLFMSSVTEENTLIRNGYSFFPAQFSLEAYKYLVTSSAKIFRAYGMTIFVTVAGTALSLLQIGRAHV